MKITPAVSSYIGI